MNVNVIEGLFVADLVDLPAKFLSVSWPIFCFTVLDHLK